ncbi:MAG TPA: hypothetical protein VGU02_04665 [Gaiellaceae bacterium]|nr:hypothetical protein [Gaiellaceae bacterium]
MGAITGSAQRYALGLGQLWPDVSRALTRLETIAGDPYAYAPEDVAEQLTHLQYRLHVAAESILGLRPPPGAESVHAELSDALECARDTTSEVAEAVADDGIDAFRFVLHEWRGALFRVRLARLRIAPPAVPRPEPVAEVDQAEIGRPLMAFLLAVGGALAFAGGATFGEWPIWAAGMLAVVGGMLTYRP